MVQSNPITLDRETDRSAAQERHFLPRLTSDVQAVRTIEELDACESLWKRLSCDRNAVQDFVYQRAWAVGIGTGQQLHVLVSDGPACAGVAPLVINRGGCGWLTLLAAEMYEILDFLYADTAALVTLSQAIVRTGRPLYLKRVPADSPTVAALEAAYRGRGLVLKQASPGAPCILLDSSWAEPEMHLNSGRKSDLRRALRLAERLGPVQIEIVSPDCESLPPLLEEAFRVEAAGWKGESGTALALDPLRSGFFQRLARHAAVLGTLRMCFLRIGGKAAAAQIAIEAGDTFSLLRAGYDQHFARCSPGNLLTRESIRYAVRRGLRNYEFNGSVEPWTKIWTDQERACCSLRAWPLTPRGLAALAAGASRIEPGSLIRGLQQWK